MNVVLNDEQIKTIIDDLTHRIASSISDPKQVVTIGIRSRGEILAQRLSKQLSEKIGKNIPCGTLDITLYRDDIHQMEPMHQPEVRTTEIGFNIDDKVVILVDDVLHTGRSTRAALDALIDLGRPKVIQLAVLVERTGREFPIQADFAGHKINVSDDQAVHVHFVEFDGTDEVVIKKN